jgi:hypothetical protein
MAVLLESLDSEAGIRNVTQIQKDRTRTRWQARAMDFEKNAEVFRAEHFSVRGCMYKMEEELWLLADT